MMKKTILSVCCILCLANVFSQMSDRILLIPKDAQKGGTFIPNDIEEGLTLIEMIYKDAEISKELSDKQLESLIISLQSIGKDIIKIRNTLHDSSDALRSDFMNQLVKKAPDFFSINTTPDALGFIDAYSVSSDLYFYLQSYVFLKEIKVGDVVYDSNQLLMNWAEYITWMFDSYLGSSRLRVGKYS